MTTEAAKAAKARYDAKTAKYISLKLNKKTDDDIIKWLEAKKNIQGYLKQLIREDMMKGEGTMNSSFYDRVIREQIVDTKQYRYIAKERHDANEQWIEIQRLPIESLDTTAAIDGWETVKIIK